MNHKLVSTARIRALVATICAVAITSRDLSAFEPAGGPPRPQSAASTGEASRIPADQLDSLVAPIALYPDPLLAQTLAASTYPLEILQLHQWLPKNPGLKDKALADAVAAQNWDPTVQALSALPDVVKRLADDIQWATDLGNAFLAQQSDVMDAVQRMRQKAEGTDNLKSTPQQVVETKVIENKEVIVIEQAEPEVVYVPAYDPVAVYGPPVYPYPSIYYPPAGYYAAGAAISFGVGVAMGAAWGGGWGWGAGWGDNDITINNNNVFNRNANVNANRTGTVSNNWQHRPEHRGGAPYRDRATADRFGGTARGDSLASRQGSARQQINRQGGDLRSSAPGASSAVNRPGGGAGVGDRASGGTDRVGSRDPSSGGADRVGSRDVSRSPGGGNRSAFEGGSQKYNGASARASSSRGSSSVGSAGGGSRGGGSRGGGRSGGGRGR